MWILVVVMLVLGFIFPTAMKYLVAGPILGFCFGGFAFAIACCLSTSFVSWHIFGVFVICATLVAEVFLAQVDG